MLTRRQGAVVLWLSGIGLLTLIVGPSESFHKCINDRKHNQPYQTTQKEGRHFVEMVTTRVRLNVACGFISANDNNGGIAALAGVVVAWFTGTLWWVTRRSVTAAEISANAAMISAQTAERSLNELERAYLYIDSIEAEPSSFFANRRDYLWDTNPIAKVTIVNHGRTPCVVVSASLVLEWLKDVPQFEFGGHAASDVEPLGSVSRLRRPVGPGGSYTFPGISCGTFTWEDARATEPNTEGFYCYGWIRYIDIFNKSHPLMFCRRFDTELGEWDEAGGSAKNYTR